ncbi:hypothetical protein DWW10_21740 [Bacteroides intestinalis]|uniref:Uncharacterized protein n=1 Tax=Bacteroides intestinalis TaxID=329854 RepID=A0A412XTM9_9BACE|nr:hypothetical protein DWW10_21740 [Bacteroides intestinalis]RHA60912.1 hypothetical protein DW932_08030 [Bacteroides intestinalis]
MSMNVLFTYGVIFLILFILELAYFKVADRFNIIDNLDNRTRLISNIKKQYLFLILLIRKPPCGR